MPTDHAPTASSTPARRSPPPPRGPAPPLDRFEALVRPAAFLGVTALLVITWGFAGISKFLTPGVPEWFTTQFGGTFLARVPGLTASYYSIAVTETLVFLIAAGSFLRGEFLPRRRAVLLRVSLAASTLVFAQLLFGLRLVGEFQGAFNLFTYGAGAMAMLLAVHHLDPAPVNPEPPTPDATRTPAGSAP